MTMGMERWGGGSLTANTVVGEVHGFLLRDVWSQSTFKSSAQGGRWEERKWVQRPPDPFCWAAPMPAPTVTHDAPGPTTRWQMHLSVPSNAGACRSRFSKAIKGAEHQARAEVNSPLWETSTVGFSQGTSQVGHNKCP